MKKGDHIKFKPSTSIVWLYGFVDTVRGEMCTVTYGSKKDFEKALKDNLELAPLCDVPTKDLTIIKEI